MIHCPVHAAELAASADPTLRSLPYCLLCAIESPGEGTVNLAAAAAPVPLVAFDLVVSEARFESFLERRRERMAAQAI